MTVKELVTLLQKCNPDDIVMYSIKNSLWNENYTIYDAARKEVCEYDFGIDDVLIGGGTSKGFVFLTEDLWDE